MANVIPFRRKPKGDDRKAVPAEEVPDPASGGSRWSSDVIEHDDGSVTMTLELDAATSKLLGTALSDPENERGLRERNIQERMRIIREEGLDLDMCIDRGGSWAAAARRIRSGDVQPTLEDVLTEIAAEELSSVPQAPGSSDRKD